MTSAENLKTGMVITVGVGRDIENAIYFSIKRLNPDFVVFVVSRDSKDVTIPRILHVFEKNNTEIPHYGVVVADDVENVGKVLESTRKAISKLKKKGIKPDNITMDYTTGTKPMSAGALYAAILEGCGMIRYITGRRDPAMGRVISGTEGVQEYRIKDLISHLILRDAVNLFNTYQFAAAEQIIRNFFNGNEEDQKKVYPRLYTLMKLCRAYERWDAFDHKDASEAFGNIENEILGEFIKEYPQIGKNKGWVEKIAKSLSDENAATYSKELLVDLWMNALRRLKEGRYVDAVSRFYRLTEMIAQYQLKKEYDIDTGDVNLEKVPEHLREKLEKEKDEEGRVKLSLFKAYDLLEALNDPLGAVLNDEKQKRKFRGILSYRNESIAAHGIKPVTKDFAEKFKERAEELLKIVVDGLEELSKKAEFPKLVFFSKN